MRKLMWFAIGFGAACLMCVYWLPNSWILPLILLCVPFGFLLGWKRMRKLAFLCIGCGVGLLWFLVFQRFYLLPAAAVDGLTLDTTVTVTDFSYETSYGTAADGKIELEGKPYQIRIYINDKQELEPGDTVIGSFRLRYTAPGGMEEATHHSGKGILLLGYQRGYVEVLRTGREKLEYFAANLRQMIRERLREIFPEDVFPFTQALLLGDGSELDYATDTAFKISGIRHIIAVSGLHVSILYTLLNTLTLRRRYLTALLCIPVLLLFAAVAGFTPSVTRACIMVGLMVLSQVLDKEYDSPTALGFAVLVMLTVNPLVITSVGFQLSVGCVAGILLFQKPIADWIKSQCGKAKGNKVRAGLIRWLSSSVSVTLGAMSLTTPLSACYFGTVSIIGVVTNLLTLWVVNLIFNGLVLLCIVSLLSIKAAACLAWVLAWPIRFVLAAARTLAAFPLAAVYTVSPYIAGWLVFAYVLLIVFCFGNRKRPAVYISCVTIGLCFAVLASWMEPLMDDVRVTALDVGQGQCILLQSEGRTFLVDCGGDNDELAADTAAETLLSQGIRRLDGIILTHGDRDHAGGIVNLLSRVQTDLLLLPSNTDQQVAAGIANAADAEIIYVSENLSLSFGTAEITIFGPTFAAESNENSLCILFTEGNCDILITGDRSEFGEMLLLREASLPKVEVLIVGHHGSKYSTSQELLDAVLPEVAVISVGADNFYGHPAQEVLDRLEDHGCSVYRTDENGTIIIRR